MKVLQINNFHYKRGGSDVVYFNTTDLLALRGHEVVHFSMHDEKNVPSPYSEFFVKGKDFLSLGFIEQLMGLFEFFYSREASAKLEKLLKQEKPDVAHIHIFYGGLTSSILSVLRTHRIPVVVTLHEYKLICPVYTFLDSHNAICEKCAGSKYIYCAIKRCNKNNFFYSVVMAIESYFRDIFFKPKTYFHRIICVSKFSMQKHLRYKPELAGRILHLYNFSPTLENLPFTSRHQGYYLYFGRLSREKGVFTLLDVWKRFADVQLKIIGTGPLEQRVRELVSEQRSVSFLGYKSGDELYHLIQNAAFVIVPSEWYENNPMSIIESYFLGTPVIGANIGGIPEILIENQTGFLFEANSVEALANAIYSSLHVSSERYSQLSQNCWDFAKKNFSSENHYRKLISAYTSVIGS